MSTTWITGKLRFREFTNLDLCSSPRNIGKNGLKVPLLGFSAWNSFSENISEEAADALVTMAYEHGVNYFDTGDGFNNGQSELMLGKILKRKSWPRSSYLVSTKIFWKGGPSAHLGEGLSRKFIIEAVEASLRRLQLRYIDLLVINKLDAMCPMEEIVRTMSYLINNGIIFYWGTSRFSPMHISEAFSISRKFNCPPPICEQMEYHMLFRDKMELQMLELFHKSGIGCIVWSPSSLQNDHGIQLITRKPNAYEAKSFLALKYPKLMKLCDRIGCDLVQLSLGKHWKIFRTSSTRSLFPSTAWCLQNENVNCVLISATSLQELRNKLDSIKVSCCCCCLPLSNTCPLLLCCCC